MALPHLLCISKCFYMKQTDQLANTLQDIKQMMERSSRFISLSGLSGIAAGSCALIGAAAAYTVLQNAGYSPVDYASANVVISKEYKMSGIDVSLLIIAALTFVAAFVSAFIFTYMRCKKSKIPVWNTSSRRLTFSTLIPMAVGGIFLLKLLEQNNYEFIGPGCLIFYGLAVLNGSKYTLQEVRYLGYALLLLGLINLWVPGLSIFFWAIGFGLLHIIYGTIMWMKYEKNQPQQPEEE
jgi:hypothetical protein